MRIDYEPFVHPADSECLTALERGSRCLADVLREFDSHYDETPGSETRRQVLVEVDSRQCPDIHKMLADVVRKLGIRAPGLFIELSERNYVRLDGCDTPDVILSSAFADSASDDECKAAIAGACGHILCRHAKLRAVERILRSAVGCHGGVVDFAESMALAIMPGETYRMLIQGLGGVIRKFLADDEKTLMDAYARWCCASEFSADRVAAYVMGSVEPVIRAQIRLAGGAGLRSSRTKRLTFWRSAYSPAGCSVPRCPSVDCSGSMRWPGRREKMATKPRSRRSIPLPRNVTVPWRRSAIVCERRWAFRRILSADSDRLKRQGPGNGVGRD